ncbi:transcriptional regulator [Saccharomonospora sp.]|uniref:transcriptional regulator n=1 Tax=Saccharomonospora sp. TaxID=33913 RepID=UPI002602D178|nr:transcriptional regulator [Saccharomonospora sp.]
MSTHPTAARKLLIACVCVLSLVLCCGLAWWQWGRYTSAGGSFQNLGYVLQWPLFGLFPAFMFWRLRALRRQAKEQQSATSTTPEPESRRPRPAAVPAPRRDTGATRVQAVDRNADAPMDSEDAALAEYNAYLAELNAREQEGN